MRGKKERGWEENEKREKQVGRQVGTRGEAGHKQLTSFS